ncbi:hypothetical protein GCM10027203_63810 [Nonomuraea fastidiosa]
MGVAELLHALAVGAQRAHVAAELDLREDDTDAHAYCLQGNPRETARSTSTIFIKKRTTHMRDAPGGPGR